MFWLKRSNLLCTFKKNLVSLMKKHHHLCIYCSLKNEVQEKEITHLAACNTVEARFTKLVCPSTCIINVGSGSEILIWGKCMKFGMLVIVSNVSNFSTLRNSLWLAVSDFLLMYHKIFFIFFLLKDLNQRALDELFLVKLSYIYCLAQWWRGTKTLSQWLLHY